MIGLKRLLLLLLSTILCLSAFMGCAETDDGDDTDDATEYTSSDTSAVPEPPAVTDRLLFIENGACVYQILRPRGEEWDPVVAILENTLHAENISYTVRTYSRYATYDAIQKQILVGDIPYPESEALNEGIRPSDYRMALSGNKICITGGTASAALSMMTYFIESYLAPALKNVTSETYIGFANYINTYFFDSITLGGIPLQDFTIVYNTNDSITGQYDKNIEVFGGDCKADAELLRDTIAKLYGWQLAIRADTEPAVPYEIILPGAAGAPTVTGVPKLEPMHSYGKFAGGKLVFTSYGNFSMRNTGKGFANYLKNQTPVQKNLHILSDFTIDVSCLDIDSHARAEGTEVRFVTSNIAASKYNWGGYSDIPASLRKELLFAEFAVLDADVYGLQEVCPEWATIIKEAFGDTYTFVNETNIGLSGKTVENNNWICFRTEKFRVVAQAENPIPYDTYLDANGNLTENAGAKIRNVNWVILEDKTSGDRFGFTNSHWDWKNEEFTDPQTGTTYPIYQNYQAIQYGRIVKSLMEEYECPIFSCADFNCPPMDPNDPAKLQPKNRSFDYFLTEAGMIDTRTTAAATGKLLNDTGSTHGFATREVRMPYWTSIDQITYTPREGVEILSYRTLYENSLLDLSDHVPRCVDVKL